MRLSDAVMGVLVEKSDRTNKVDIGWAYEHRQPPSKTMGFIVGICENVYKEVCFDVQWQDGKRYPIHPAMIELVKD